MSKKTSWGQKAYSNTRKSGGSKSEARANQQTANKAYHDNAWSKHNNSSSNESNNHSSDSSINNGSWHTASDL